MPWTIVNQSCFYNQILLLLRQLLVFGRNWKRTYYLGLSVQFEVKNDAHSYSITGAPPHILADKLTLFRSGMQIIPTTSLHSRPPSLIFKPSAGSEFYALGYLIFGASAFASDASVFCIGPWALGPICHHMGNCMPECGFYNLPTVFVFVTDCTHIFECSCQNASGQSNEFPKYFCLTK